MKLFFIRHGETDWNQQGKIQGKCDIELNSNGIIQAQELCKRVINNKYKFAKIYSSPQKRAYKTAEILGQAINTECIPVKGLMEMNLGDWEGHSWDEIAITYKDEYEKWHNNRRYTKTPNGECYQDVIERVLESLNKIIKDNKEDVAIVTHSAVIKTLECYLTDTPFEDIGKFKIENTEILEIDSERIERVNILKH